MQPTGGVNGAPFTARREENLRSWLYRIRPSALHSPFRRIDAGLLVGRFDEAEPTPELYA